VRAILEVRDRRHNETHAALVEVYQALVVELIDQGALQTAALADRLDVSRSRITEEPHGDAARGLVTHLVTWLRSLEPKPPTPHPPAWSVPPPTGPNAGTLDDD